MALENFIGFESGGDTEVATAGTSSYSTSTVYEGTYSLRTNPTTTGTGHASLGSIATNGLISNLIGPTGFSFMFRYATKPASGDEEFFSILAAFTLNPFITLRLNSSGNIVLYGTNGNTLVATGATALAANTWYRISGFLQGGTSQPYSVSINGVSELSGSATLTTATAFGTRRLGKNVNRNSQTIDFFFDNVFFDNAAEPTTITSSKIKLGRVIADGTVQQWTAGTNSSNYQEIDEVPPSSADYVKSTGAANDKALFLYQSSSTLQLGDNIDAVKAIFRMREDTSVNSSNKVGIYDSSGVAVSETSAQNHAVTTASMARFLSGPITKADFDSWQIGSLEENAVAMRLEFAGIAVLYTLLQTLSMPTIASGAVLYSPTLVPQAIAVSMPTIASTLALYAPSVTPQAVTLAPPLISSTAILYEPVISQGVTLFPPFISSGETLYSPTIIPQSVTLLAPFISSTEVLYSPVVSPDQDLLPPLIVSSNVLYPPTLVPQSVTILMPIISSGNALYPPALALGSVNLLLPFIASTATLYAPAVANAGFLLVPFLANANILYPPTVTLRRKDHKVPTMFSEKDIIDIISRGELPQWIGIESIIDILVLEHSPPIVLVVRQTIEGVAYTEKPMIVDQKDLVSSGGRNQKPFGFNLSNDKPNIKELE